MRAEPKTVTARGSSAKRALWLDVLIVVGSVALLIWHVAVSRGVAAGPALLMVAAAMVGVFLVVKLVLVGSESLSRSAMRTFALGIVLAGGGSAAGVSLAAGREANIFLVGMPIAGVVAVLSARRQIIDSDRGERAGSTGVTRSYRVLPYAALAAVFALLIVVCVRADRALLVVAASAAALTGLVVYRQLVAFGENDRLIVRLDAGLLDLRHEEERFRLLVQNSSDIVTITDLDGTLRYTSPVHGPGARS